LIFLKKIQSSIRAVFIKEDLKTSNNIQFFAVFGLFFNGLRFLFWPTKELLRLK